MWQQLVSEQDPERFSLLSVAVDVQPERVRAFADGLSFPTAVDSTGALGRLFDFDVVPNGVFLDEEGTIRFLHVGGFDLRRPEFEEQVRALIAQDFGRDGTPPAVKQEPLELEVLRLELVERPEDAGLHLALADALLREGRAGDALDAYGRAAALDPRDWSAHFGAGTALQAEGKTDEAVRAWRRALALDPANYTVRKQIWRAESPERFYPEIDQEWQKEQLAKEGYPSAG